MKKGLILLSLWGALGCVQNASEIHSEKISPAKDSGKTVHVDFGNKDPEKKTNEAPQNPETTTTTTQPTTKAPELMPEPLTPPSVVPPLSPTEAVPPVASSPAAPIEPIKAEPIKGPDPEFPLKITRTTLLEDYVQEFTEALEEAAEKYNKLDPKGKVQCRPQSSHAIDKALRIRFAIGYEDFSPDDFVGDEVERQILQKLLQAPCEGDFPLCDFNLVYKGSFRSILEKITPERKIVITITTSSVSTENSFNETSDDQVAKSDYAANQFLSSFRVEDVVIYWGHGRSGGGPDFHPPELTKNKHVNYSIYETQKTGRSLLQAGLGLKGVRTQYVGMFGCYTNSFTGPLSKIFPKVNFVGSKGEIFADEMGRGSLIFVAGIINNDCRSGLVNKIGLDNTDRRDKAAEVFVVQGPAYEVRKKKPVPAPKNH